MFGAVNGATATRLIETAERLIAERGVHGVSLREIGAEAGQRNTGAVRYHFGTKQRLLNAVFEHRMVTINDRRLAMLAELDSAGRGYDVRALAEAFLYPLAEMLGEPGRPSWYLRFCIHAAYVEGTAPSDLEGQDWTRGVAIISARYQALLSEAGVPAQLQAERWSLFSGHVTHALADRELMVQHAPRRVSTPRSVFLANVLDTAVGLAVAPVSEHTIRQIEDRRTA
jgi:AcrR family transcriptional regulator